MNRTATPGMAIRMNLDGPLGQAVEASQSGRLRTFIKGPQSDAIALFHPGRRAESTAGDWYGEHAGKWLVAATAAALRAGDEELSENVGRIADALVEMQEPEGYLGTYAAAGPRFTRADSAGKRTWDVWVHAYAMLGLIEAHRLHSNSRFLESAMRVADLLMACFGDNPARILAYGNHAGLSSLIVIGPLSRLASRTGERKYADFAETLLDGAVSLDPAGRLLRGDDIAAIGTGKIYQLAWLLQGMAALSREVSRPEWLAAAKRGWECIREAHLTLGGGPWGGVGRHKEVFNDPGFFSPSGMVETCSAMAWIDLSQELHAIEPDPRYPEEIERTLYNTILGAADPNGEDWDYFTFPNGRRNPTYNWACCKSSGAMALELGASAFYSPFGDGLSIDLFGPNRAQVGTPSGAWISVEQETRYPADGDILIRISADSEIGPVRLRIPNWARPTRLEVDGVPGPAAVPGTYLEVDLSSRRQSVLRIEFEMRALVHKVAQTIDHHGQEIVRDDYFGMTRGPLAYATGLIDGFKKCETVRAPHLNLDSRFEFGETPEHGLGPAATLRLPDRAAIEWLPYVDAGGRRPGAWRATWMGVAWQ